VKTGRKVGLFSLVLVMNRPLIPADLARRRQIPAAHEELPVTPLPSFEAAALVHLDAAYTLARYLTGRPDIAEDIVQEAVLRAFSHFDKKRVENARSWLLAIVRNCFLTWYARDRKDAAKSNVENLFQLDAKATIETSDPQTPESILIERQDKDAVRAVIERLPEHIREVLVLRDVQDLSYQEIANILGVPIGTVMSRLARARKSFAEAWMRATEQKAIEGKQLAGAAAPQCKRKSS
jgi:RNA polymerase sigma-70 factor, ECF subfamily